MINEKKKVIYFGIIIIFLISLISATDLGTFKQGEEIDLYQMCSNCSYVNITSITYPNASIETIGQFMTKNGEDFTYTFSDTSLVGDYQYNVCGDKNEDIKCEVITFDVTPSGFNIDFGQSIGLFGSLILMVLIGLISLFIAMRSENKIMNLSFYTLSIIIFIMSILYTVVIIQQTLFGFESILTGIESFWFIIKMLITVGILAFIIIIFLIMLKLWRIKRWLYDE